MYSSKFFTVLSILALVLLIAVTTFQGLEMNTYELFASLF